MGKLVVITGSPRKMGNSSKLAAAFIEEAKLCGFEVKRFDVPFLFIDGCRFCNNCYKDDTACIFQDDFRHVAEAVEDCDGIIFVSPLFWSSFTAQIKACIDRFFCFYTGGRARGKKYALIATCEDNKSSAFDGMRAVYNGVVNLLGGTNVGELLATGVGALGAVDRTDYPEQAKELARKFR